MLLKPVLMNALFPILTTESVGNVTADIDEQPLNVSALIAFTQSPIVAFTIFV